MVMTVDTEKDKTDDLLGLIMCFHSLMPGRRQSGYISMRRRSCCKFEEDWLCAQAPGIDCAMRRRAFIDPVHYLMTLSYSDTVPNWCLSEPPTTQIEFQSLCSSHVLFRLP